MMQPFCGMGNNATAHKAPCALQTLMIPMAYNTLVSLKYFQSTLINNTFRLLNNIRMFRKKAQLHTEHTLTGQDSNIQSTMAFYSPNHIVTTSTNTLIISIHQSEYHQLVTPPRHSSL